MNENIQDAPESITNANAVSIFGQAGSANDFPVLKAFQEYIDAEQAKARKRMLGLSIFFVVLLVVVIVVFMMIMATMLTRNQALSDRLLDFALREKAQQPVVNVQQPTPVVSDSTSLMKPLLDKIENLAASLSKPHTEPPPAPVARPAAPSPETLEAIKLQKALQQQLDELKAEREREKARQAAAAAAQEKAARKEAEKEAFLRRQYPEYYARQDALRQSPPPPVAAVPPAAGVVSSAVPVPAVAPRYQIEEDDDAELKELVRKARAARVKPATPPAEAKPVPTAKKGTPPPSNPTTKVAPLPPSPKTETLTVGGTDGDSIPWLIELPKEKGK